MVECHDIRRCNYMYLKVSGVKCDYFEFNILTRIRSYLREKPIYELSKRAHCSIECFIYYKLISIKHNAGIVLTAPVRTVIVRLLLLFRTFTACKDNKRRLKLMLSLVKGIKMC